MKKLLAPLLLAPLLAACGGPTTPAQPQETGTITLRLVKGALEGAALPDPSNVRVLVTNPRTGFRSVKDAAVGGAAAINVPVPATADYIVEAISYKPGQYNTIKLFLKYGKVGGVTVEAGKVAEVVVELQRPNVSVNMPSSVTTGQAFQLRVADVPDYIGTMRAVVSNEPTSSLTPTGNEFFARDGVISANAPTELGSGRMYVQLYGYLDSDKFCIDCSSELFRFDTHDPVLGQTPLSAALNPPSSGIGVVIRY